MNREQVKGRIDQAAGKIKEEAGDAMDDKRLEREGQVEKGTGHARAKVGDTVERLQDKLDKR